MTDYEILGLKTGFTLKELRRAFRLASKKAHPDTGGSSEDFRRLTQAYENLMANTEPTDQSPGARRPTYRPPEKPLNSGYEAMQNDWLLDPMLRDGAFESHRLNGKNRYDNHCKYRSIFRDRISELKGTSYINNILRISKDSYDAWVIWVESVEDFVRLEAPDEAMKKFVYAKFDKVRYAWDRASAEWRPLYNDSNALVRLHRDKWFEFGKSLSRSYLGVILGDYRTNSKDPLTSWRVRVSRDEGLWCTWRDKDLYKGWRYRDFYMDFYYKGSMDNELYVNNMKNLPDGERVIPDKGDNRRKGFLRSIWKK
jgi:curved DNA-binding protein CbpA